MKINTTAYNNYSPLGRYLRGDSSRASMTPVQSHGNTGRPHPGAISAEQSAPQTITANDPDQQGAETSNSRPEQQKPEQQEPAADSRLTQAESQLLTELKQADTEVRNHEMAHVTAGGGLITSGASFTYKRGPDGKNYAVAGEVGIDTSAIPGDPQSTLQKMKQIKRSALAPASPSAQDLRVASNADARAAKASSELTILMAEEQAAADKTQAFGSLKHASDSYTKVNNLPEEDNSTFKLAV